MMTDPIVVHQELLRSVHEFANSIEHAKSLVHLDRDYFAVLDSARRINAQITQQTLNAYTTTWKSYLESWLMILCPIKPSDPYWRTLIKLQAAQHDLLDSLQSGPLFCLYQDKKNKMQHSLNLAQANPIVFIESLFDKRIDETSDQEIALFLGHSEVLLAGRAKLMPKELLCIRSKIYLWLSNFALVNAPKKERSDLAWWLGMIGQSFLFHAYQLTPNPYTASELYAINQQVHNWLSTYQIDRAKGKNTEDMFQQLNNLMNPRTQTNRTPAPHHFFQDTSKILGPTYRDTSNFRPK